MSDILTSFRNSYPESETLEGHEHDLLHVDILLVSAVFGWGICAVLDLHQDPPTTL